MPLSHVLAFAAVVSVVIAIPGPSVLFTISRALTVGRRKFFWPATIRTGCSA